MIAGNQDREPRRVTKTKNGERRMRNDNDGEKRLPGFHFGKSEKKFSRFPKLPEKLFQKMASPFFRGSPGRSEREFKGAFQSCVRFFSPSIKLVPR